MLSEKQKGEWAVYAGAFLGSLFPIVTIMTVSIMPPLFAAALGTGISSIFFALYITWRKHWSQLLLTHAWRDMLLATLFIGITYYGLLFIGYQYTSAGNGAIDGIMEVFFSFLIINILWKHERFVPVHAAGACLMVIGALFILIPKHTGSFHHGDLLIMLAMAAPPIGNVFAKHARKIVSSEVLLFFRSVISAVFLFILAWLLGPLPTAAMLQGSFWFLIFNGVLLLGFSKILWIEAIHRMPVAKTVSMSEINVLLTLVFAYFFLGQTITLEQIMGFLPMIGGVYLLTRK